jgi:two-component system catabolic regulation response regulator CreB/two-component system response regulator ChvI
VRGLKVSTKANARRKILLVDDELDIILSLKLFLEENGFEVDAYDNPSSAIADYKPDLYHLLILDIKMPQIDGFELYERIHKMDNNAKVFFLTAVSDFSGYKVDNKPSGENRFIQKPIDGPELLKRITV